MRLMKTRVVRPGVAAQKGVALISVLLALLLITLLGVALNAFGILNLSVATNDRESASAFFIADAGASHARQIFMRAAPGNFDPFLQFGNGVACDGDELSGGLPAPLVATDAIPTPATGGRPFTAGGSYSVSVCDDDAVERLAAPNPPSLTLPDNNPNHDANGIIMIRATGLGVNNATATIEIVVSRVPMPAVLVDGNLRLTGNPAITGPAGSLHANGNFEVPGAPCATDYASAVGTITKVGGGGVPNMSTGPGCTSIGSGGGDNPPDLRPNSQPISVPDIDPVTLKPNATIILRADGTILDLTAGPPGVVRAAGWNSWSYNNPQKKWSNGSNAMPPGVYYGEGTNLAINGNPGSTASPISVTLIAEGNIDVNGNPSFVPRLNIGSATYAMVAGADLELAGSPSVPLNGIFYARDQINFSGDAAVNGQVIAKNRQDVGTPINLVSTLPGGFMAIAGNVKITYDGSGGASSLSANTWRECRGANPASPCN